MWWIRKDERIEQRASRLFHDAVALHARGRSSEAAGKLDEAIGCSRQLAAKHPDQPIHNQATASALYLQAAAYIADRRAEKALAALDECEQLYRQLGRAGVLDAGSLVADVQLRRAGAFALLRRGASAIVELDSAVATHIQRTGGGPSLDLARALSRNGLFLALFGDPDMAVASADQALRIYLTTQNQGGQVQIRAEDAGYLNQAAACAGIIHLRFGREDIGLAAAQLGLQFDAAEADASLVRSALQKLNSGARMDAQTVEKINRILSRRLGSDYAHGPSAAPDDLPSTTLASALAASGADVDGGLARVLTRPPRECKLLIPTQRCPLPVAPTYAAKLAEIAVKTMSALPAAGIRIGLEAHYLFAAASRAQTAEMRHGFAEFGLPWARVLLACSKAFETCKDTAMALDLASWAGGVAQQLAPLAAISADAASVARECIEHHGRLLIASGDRKAGEQALAAAATM